MTQKPDPPKVVPGQPAKPATPPASKGGPASEAPIKLEGPIDANTPGMPEYLHDKDQPFVARSMTLAERNEMEKKLLPGEKALKEEDLMLDPADFEVGEYEVGEPPPQVVSKLLQAPPPYKPSTAPGTHPDPSPSGSHAAHPVHHATADHIPESPRKPATTAAVRPDPPHAASLPLNAPYVPPVLVPATPAADAAVVETPTGLNEHILAFLVALDLLTRIPLPEGVEQEHTDRQLNMRRSVIYFPLIGTFIGVITASLICAGAMIWPVWLAVLFGLGIEALWTGAANENALGVFFGSFGKGRDQARILQNLAQGQPGPRGLIAVVVYFAIRAAALLAIFEPPTGMSIQHLFAAAIASTTLGHWMILGVMAGIPPIHQDPPSPRDYVSHTTGQQMLLATMLAVPGVLGMLLLMPVPLVLALVILLIIVPWFNQFVFRHIHGVTSDCLGAICCLSQLAVLLAAAVTIRHL